LDEFGIPTLINSRYPVVYVKVTYDLNTFNRRDLKNLEEEFNLLLFATGGEIDEFWD
jgi:hypothetical protein